MYEFRYETDGLLSGWNSAVSLLSSFHLFSFFLVHRLQRLALLGLDDRGDLDAPRLQPDLHAARGDAVRVGEDLGVAGLQFGPLADWLK